MQFLILLFKILQSGGEISKDNKMRFVSDARRITNYRSKSDRAFLRLAVANCILRLCTKKEFEEAIDPENFLTLSLIIQVRMNLSKIYMYRIQTPMFEELSSKNYTKFCRR